MPDWVESILHKFTAGFPNVVLFPMTDATLTFQQQHIKIKTEHKLLSPYMHNRFTKIPIVRNRYAALFSSPFFSSRACWYARTSHLLIRIVKRKTITQLSATQPGS